MLEMSDFAAVMAWPVGRAATPLVSQFSSQLTSEN
jgi:hypothetical protein